MDLLLPKLSREYQSTPYQFLNVARAGLLLAVLMVFTPVVVADTSRAVSVGGISCQALKGKTTGHLAVEHATTWVEGYLSAQHPDNPHWAEGVERTLSRAQRASFVLAYCSKYPDATIQEAAQEIQRFIEGQLVGRPKEL